MRTMRAAVAGAVAVLMGGGYFASQVAFFQQNTAAYTQALESYPTRYVALFLLIAVIVLAFFPDRDEDKA